MISIFSKFKIGGGSERRCVELANGISRYYEVPVRILCRESSFPKQLQNELSPSVELVLDCLKSPQSFYSSDQIIVVNSDSREFTSVAFWQSFLDMGKLKGKTMCFLFNFIISPARSLCDFEKFGIKIGIAVTNGKFFNEISQKDKHLHIRSLPRMVIESPIDASRFLPSPNADKSVFKVVFLSKSYDDKWNDDIPLLVKSLSGKSSGGKRFSFSMMGAKRSVEDAVRSIPLVSLHRENSFPASDFLNKSDLFIFFPSYKRQEPWARVIGEAMMSGLPIIALDGEGGTSQQVINGNNGFLCKTVQDFIDKSVYLFEHPEVARKMGQNSRIYASEFTSKNVCGKLLRFVFKVGNP